MRYSRCIDPSKYPTRDFIYSQLRKTGLEIKETSDHLMIPCPFHREIHPSLGISLGGTVPIGVYHCFGCNVKGTWNSLAERLGLDLWGEAESEGTTFIYRTKREIHKELKVESYSLSEWSGKWKRYPSNFLHGFGARALRDLHLHCNYLYLPITYLNEIYGYCRVRLKETDPGSKYFFSKNMTKVMYPYDHVMKYNTNTIVLVEGMSDSFRLLYNGIPALSLLGVVITSFMWEQLEILNPTNIILCLDGDLPGRIAMLGSKTKDGLYSQLSNKGYNVSLFKLPEGSDPDSVDISYITQLKKLYLNLSETR